MEENFKGMRRIMTNTRTLTKPTTTSQGRARSALALVLAGTLLAGCTSNSDAASPDDAGVAAHSADGSEGATADDQERDIVYLSTDY